MNGNHVTSMAKSKCIGKENPRGFCYRTGEILSLLREAKIASSQRQSHEALFFYDEVIKQDPENKAAWWGKGCEYLYLRVHDNIKQYIKDELKCYEMTLHLNDEKDYYFTWFEKAVVHEEVGQIAEAILCYERFIELCDEADRDDLEDGARRRIIQLSENLVG